ncbi:hypothetical protein B0H11DRAFT_1902318 [Mycena galericulata]|nr:hypothetical protein B0H11DRAFT_1902318 [Mycena galericulata]
MLMLPADPLAATTASRALKPYACDLSLCKYQYYRASASRVLANHLERQHRLRVVQLHLHLLRQPRRQREHIGRQAQLEPGALIAAYHVSASARASVSSPAPPCPPPRPPPSASAPVSASASASTSAPSATAAGGLVLTLRGPRALAGGARGGDAGAGAAAAPAIAQNMEVPVPRKLNAHNTRHARDAYHRRRRRRSCGARRRAEHGGARAAQIKRSQYPNLLTALLASPPVLTGERSSSAPLPARAPPSKSTSRSSHSRAGSKGKALSTPPPHLNSTTFPTPTSPVRAVRILAPDLARLGPQDRQARRLPGPHPPPLPANEARAKAGTGPCVLAAPFPRAERDLVISAGGLDAVEREAEAADDDEQCEHDVDADSDADAHGGGTTSSRCVPQTQTQAQLRCSPCFKSAPPHIGVTMFTTPQAAEKTPAPATPSSALNNVATPAMKGRLGRHPSSQQPSAPSTKPHAGLLPFIVAPFRGSRACSCRGEGRGSAHPMAGDPSFEGEDLTVGELRARGSVRSSPLLVPEDIWRFILDQYLDIWLIPGPVIYRMQRITSGSKQVLQPYIYRHVHLRSPRHALLFLRTIESRGDLAQHIISLHFSFIPSDTQLWIQLTKYLPNFNRLVFLSFAFCNRDADPLGHILAQSIGEHLPPNVRTLHLRFSSNPEESPQAPGNTPWKYSSWASHLSNIPPPISNFFFTTPEYIIWPPNSLNHKSTLREWTARLQGRSCINSIILNCGYGDASVRTQEYLDAAYSRMATAEWAALEGSNPPPVDDQDVDDALHGMDAMQGTLGTRIVWEHANDESWRVVLFAGENFEREASRLAELFGDIQQWNESGRLVIHRALCLIFLLFESSPLNPAFLPLLPPEKTISYSIHMPHQGPPCTPPVFNPGKNLTAHDEMNDCYYWAVVVGRVPGIYLELDRALAQTFKFPGQRFKHCKIYQDAVEYWNQACRELHDHTPPQYYKVKGLTKAFATYDEALAAAAAEYIVSV